MSENRKKWIKPQLIVLGRGTPEESVLTACKLNTSGTGQNVKNSGCWKASCTNACANRVGS